MAHSAKLVVALLHIFAWSFLDTLEISNGTETDIFCLRSIKESLEDPYNYFKSWDFNNNTEGFICKFVGVDYWQSDESKGHFPREIKNCTSITGLDLSGNELSGTIPSDISMLLEFVTSLDLSSNNFAGEIPKSIVNCTYLNFLRLDNNQLTGFIPPEINQLQRLRNFSVANNLLSGPVPVFSGHTIPAESYANNLGLCGAPLEPCKPSPKKFIVLCKEGFLVGWIVAMVTVVVVMFRNTPILLVKKAITKKNKKLMKAGTRWCSTDERSKNMMMSQMERMVTRMSFIEISEATGYFNTNNVIGMGKIGMMYKAVIPNCWSLAVKRLNNCQSYETQFLSELSALGILRHDNLVPLLGYCSEQNEKILVYKYILHGNLYDWLHVGEGELKDKILEWPLRTKIAIGIARGLAWLHHKYDFRVVHLNLGSNSILLDTNFEPKISNFWGAKISSSGGLMFMNSNVIDTRNRSFVDSGVWVLGFVKRDVYDFGILLLELITRKEPTKINSSSYGFNGSLFDWITHILSNSSDIYSVIDNSLIGRRFDGEIFELLRIACTCLNPFPSQRPTMLEVYNTISTFGERDGITNGSETLMQPEIAIASSSIDIYTRSTFGERYGIKNDSEILMQSEIAIASSSNEIVELEIAETN
ncbi:putativeinactive leucine-rich repeat receptor-like protein kinase [Quercus suber]|uniref:Putativeinactive leucine-rich repeat receptor-like protein kinase n=1 Tax=Quercus suber TaxID=58331 RepID=A0AAW0KIB2_QUESU